MRKMATFWSDHTRATMVLCGHAQTMIFVMESWMTTATTCMQQLIPSPTRLVVGDLLLFKNIQQPAQMLPVLVLVR